METTTSVLNTIGKLFQGDNPNVITPVQDRRDHPEENRSLTSSVIKAIIESKLSGVALSLIPNDNAETITVSLQDAVLTVGHIAEREADEKISGVIADLLTAEFTLISKMSSGQMVMRKLKNVVELSPVRRGYTRVTVLEVVTRVGNLHIVELLIHTSADNAIKSFVRRSPAPTTALNPEAVDIQVEAAKPAVAEPALEAPSDEAATQSNPNTGGTISEEPQAEQDAPSTAESSVAEETPVEENPEEQVDEQQHDSNEANVEEQTATSDDPSTDEQPSEGEQQS